MEAAYNCRLLILVVVYQKVFKCFVWLDHSIRYKLLTKYCLAICMCCSGQAVACQVLSLPRHRSVYIVTLTLSSQLAVLSLLQLS